MRILENISMKDYSNMRVGGIAKELIFIEDKNEFIFRYFICYFKGYERYINRKS